MAAYVGWDRSNPHGGFGALSAPYAAGFRSVDAEHRNVSLEVEGSLPDWLDGVLLRNGPGRFEVGGERVHHWFDGLAMLTRFGFDDGEVRYSNRLLRSREYASVSGEGRLTAGQFGTADGGLLGALRDAVLPRITDNANVNVLRLGDRFVAITETQVGIEFDPETLETRGQHRFEDLDGQMMTAHPHVDPRTGETVTMTTAFGRTSHYRFYRAPLDGTDFRPIGSLSTDRPAYVHSFGLTAEHILLFEFPFDVNPLRLLLPGGGAFIEQYRWRPAVGTRIHVLDRRTGRRKLTRTVDPCFAFHHVNAFEDGGDLVADIAVFETPDIVEGLSLESLVAGGVPVVDGELRRYRIPQSGDPVTTAALSRTPVTLPRIAPSRDTRPYRVVYAQVPPDPEAGRPQGLVKVDTADGSSTTWGAPDGFCGEPVFVPNPDGDRADAGVVLSVVLEATEDRSSLVVLDGERFEPIAWARLPHVVPFDFHGQYFPAA